MIGTSLGPYKIIEQLGAGGMGEVYLGEDTRLGRKVAIKVLPEEYASDPERLARFEQEARAAAALNHPHIAVVHDVGSEATEDGSITHFMVQEYLEGDTLREPLKKGALPLRNALALAAEVAEALTAAHAAGIVHRDLKPENIFITEGGHAKVLDFGLAKLTEAAPSESQLSMSPTMVGTVAGQVMGTAGYMAPEQVEGGEVDGRADVFAFGCVLYEMLGGKRSFAGRSVHQTLDLIVSEEPEPLTDIKPDLPAAAHWIVRKCLAKDRAERYQSAADLVVDLRALLADVQSGVAEPAGAAARASTHRAAGARTAGSQPKSASGGRIVAAAALVVAGAALGGALAWSFLTPTAPAATPVAFSVDYPAGAMMESFAQFARFSPDGETLVLGGIDRLLVKQLGDLSWSEIDGTHVQVNWAVESINYPFFSPDGQWVGYWGGGGLKKVRIGGGAPEPVVADPGLGAGASWTSDGTIVAGTPNRGLVKVPADGSGAFTPLTRLLSDEGERNHRWPNVLPDGKHVLFTIGTPGEPAIGVASLETGEHWELFDGWSPQYLEEGYLIYAQLDDLMIVPFDLESLQATGTPQVAQEGVFSIQWGSTPQALYSISRSGSLTFVPGTGRNPGPSGRLVLVDRDGTPTSLTEAGSDPLYPRFTPDGTAVTVSLQRDDRSMWAVSVGEADYGRETQYQLAGNQFTHAHRGNGTFAFSSESGQQDGQEVYVRATGGGGDVTRLPFPGQLLVEPDAFSPDNSLLALTALRPATRGDIVLLPVDGGEPIEFGSATNDERAADFSSTGLIAYVSDREGQIEVFVEKYPPDSTGPRKASQGGGGEPVFSPDGQELYYRRGDAFYVVDVTSEPDLELTSPRLLFERPYALSRVGSPNYDVSPDGSRFVMVETTGQTIPARVNVILNWFERVKERLGGR